MTIKQELLIAISTIIVVVMWLCFAGLVGYFEQLDNELVNAGINIWEWINDRK